MKRLAALLLFSMTVFAADTKPLPEVTKYKLEAINAKIEKTKVQMTVLQLQFERVQAERQQLDKDHQAAIAEAYQKAGLKPEKWSLDEAAGQFVKKGAK